MALKLMARILAVYLFICLLLSIIPTFCQNVSTEGTGDYPPPSEGDWLIENDTQISNETIVMNGDLFVTDNATLTMQNITLLFNSSLSNLCGIYIDSRARLNIHNSNLTSTSGPWVFEVKGDMVMERSEVSNLWAGIEIYYGDVWIGNTSIYYCTMNGIYCEGTPTIYNNTIHSNYRGIVINLTASPKLYNNTITNNAWGILCHCFLNYTIIVGNNISNNTEDGINAELGYLELHDNIIASNGEFGVRGDHTIINASNNLIYDNQRWGLFSLGGPIYHSNNTFEKGGMHNGEGSVLQEWEVLIKIYDANNESLEDVNLTIYDSQGSIMWEGTTIGNIRLLYLREYEIASDGSEIMHTPFTINVSKDSYTNSTTYDIGFNQEVSVILEYGEKEDGSDSSTTIPTLIILLIALLVIVCIFVFLLLMSKKSSN